jgi:hypothetical protein
MYSHQELKDAVTEAMQETRPKQQATFTPSDIGPEIQGIDALSSLGL